MPRLIDADALLKDADKRQGAYGWIYSKEDIENAPKEYISTLEDGIKIRDQLIKTLELDILLLERRNGNEYNSDER